MGVQYLKLCKKSLRMRVLIPPDKYEFKVRLSVIEDELADVGYIFSGVDEVAVAFPFEIVIMSYLRP